MSDHFMTRKQVVAVTGRSATSLWRDVKAGAFPPPRQISVARIGWLYSEIEAWLKSRPVSNYATNTLVSPFDLNRQKWRG